ncbi:hypothetical protein ONQ62_26410, partial [Salmonella enterica subsp. enterica serovar Virginia]|nr:hypothetical protein [Salmonella enterica subsp. enterica serovar Virginia]
WNAQGQLTRVISGNTETHYGYDALGRRIRKATYGRHTGHTARLPCRDAARILLICTRYPAHDFTQHTPRRHKKTGHCVRFVIVS